MRAVEKNMENKGLPVREEAVGKQLLAMLWNLVLINGRSVHRARRKNVVYRYQLSGTFFP